MGPHIHKRGPWSQQEDSWLLTLVHSQGAHNWVKIAQIISTRTPKQCRERYHQNLKPTLDHSPITPEEGLEIERLVGEMGKRWAEIARRLRGRSDNAVKNWWNGGMNRRRRLVDRREGGYRNGAEFNERSEHISYSRAYIPSSPPAHDPSMTMERMRSPPRETGGSLRKQQTIVIPPSGRLVEPPMISPGSEAPSLVSDNGSHFSPSPQFSHSPSLSSPAVRRLDSRRESNAFGMSLSNNTSPLERTLPPPKFNSYGSQSGSTNSLQQLAEMATNTPRVTAPDYTLAPSTRSPPQTEASRYYGVPEVPPPARADPRDSRMSLSNLLD